MSKQQSPKQFNSATRALDFISEVSSSAKKLPKLYSPYVDDPVMYAAPKSDEGGDDYEPLPAKGTGLQQRPKPNK